MLEANDRGRLSRKPIPPNQRLIFALDVPTIEAARDLVRQLDDAVSFYKLGSELFMTGDYFELAGELIDQGKLVFADLKFSETPRTVAASVSQLLAMHATFTSVMADDAQQVKAACDARNGVKILAVTVLTHLNDSDLRDMGFSVGVEELVLRRARSAWDLGCDGFIASGLEAVQLRKEFGEEPLIVCPGIRLDQRPRGDDQKRIVTPRQAFLNGADYIVVGRPIREAPDPRAAAEKMQAEIRELFG